MITRLQITALVAIAVGSIAITRLIAGEAVSFGWFTSIGVAVSVDVAAVAIFNVWAWRWRVWRGWFVKRPCIGGDWSVRLAYQRGEERGTVDATLSVNQTYAAVNARLQSDESQGDLISSAIVEEGGRYKFTGVYRNEPRLAVRDHSPMHNGAFILDVDGDTLRGHYWTDRGTRGEFIAERAGEQP